MIRTRRARVVVRALHGLAVPVLLAVLTAASAATAARETTQRSTAASIATGVN
jgi:hypothetical protein